MKNNIEEDIKRCKKIITKKFNLDYSIDNVDKEAIENVLAEYRRLKQENEKKDKMIELIYEHFYEFMNRCPGSGMKLLKDKGFNSDKCDKCESNTANCKECIKQYFERKVENG